jgi:hypothetical protein
MHFPHSAFAYLQSDFEESKRFSDHGHTSHPGKSGFRLPGYAWAYYRQLMRVSEGKLLEGKRDAAKNGLSMSSSAGKARIR